MPSRMRLAGFFGVLLCTPLMLRAQITNGKKPQLPAPYATKSAPNSPNKSKPPAGFLPTVPSGFRVNIFATNFKVPRWLAVAPNGDIFVADMGAGEIVILHDPKNSGGAQARETFVNGQRRRGVEYRHRRGADSRRSDDLRSRWQERASIFHGAAQSRGASYRAGHRQPVGHGE